MTGTFLVALLEERHAYFIAYDYNTNAIIPKVVPDFKDRIIIKAFKEVFTELKSKGHIPTFNITDNQATRPIKELLKERN